MGPAANAEARLCALLAVIEAHAPNDAVTWLRGGLPRAGSPPISRGVFFGFYAGAARRLRGSDAALSGAEREQLAAAGVAHPEAWSLADFARAALLVAALAAVPPSEQVAIATEALRKGDSAERIALLRSLGLLPASERFVPLAVEACRTNVLGEFEAIACENPFPAGAFPEPSFNQLVIKTLFLELALDRVVGWRARMNPELARMACDYRAERVAAGRAVSADLERLVGALTG